MNFGGDIPQYQRDLIKELIRVEKLIDEGSSIPAAEKSKAYTALAHDWYDLEFEEEGHNLLLKANSTYPDYFKEKVAEHMKEDSHFSILIQRMSGKLISLFSVLFNKAGKND